MRMKFTINTMEYNNLTLYYIGNSNRVITLFDIAEKIKISVEELREILYKHGSSTSYYFKTKEEIENAIEELESIYILNQFTT